MNIEIDPNLDPTVGQRVTAMIRNEVVPALRRAVGATMLLPASMSLAPGRGHGGVPSAMDLQTTRITNVGMPVVRVEGSDEELRHLVSHELAHFHELTTRMKRRIELPSVLASMFWTEYYAQRVAWRSGFAGPWVQTLGRGAVEQAEAAAPLVAKDGTSGDMLGPLYTPSWVMAGAAEVPSSLDIWRPNVHIVSAVEIFQVDMSRAFRKFPAWPRQTIDRLGIITSALKSVMPAD